MEPVQPSPEKIRETVQEMQMLFGGEAKPREAINYSQFDMHQQIEVKQNTPTYNLIKEVAPVEQEIEVQLEQTDSAQDDMEDVVPMT
jgi:hypothetical protein